MLLIIGTDDALLEGLAQSLAGTGQRILTARSLDEGIDVLRGRAPLMVIVHRSLVADATVREMARLPLAAGGAFVTYRGHEDPPGAGRPGPATSRITMAELELPLERNRLVALVAHLSSRAHDVGRKQEDTPPESPAS